MTVCLMAIGLLMGHLLSNVLKVKGQISWLKVSLCLPCQLEDSKIVNIRRGKGDNYL